MLELDVYLQAACSFIAAGTAAGCIAWLAGYAISFVFGLFNIAVDSPADM